MVSSLAAQSLMRNIREGNAETVETLISNGIINLDERDEVFNSFPLIFNLILFSIFQDGQTFLMIACQKGDLDIVRLLLDAPNVDVNAVDNVSENTDIFPKSMTI